MGGKFHGLGGPKTMIKIAQLRSLVLMFGLLSLPAFAETTLQSFNWRADSRYTLSLLQDGDQVKIEGELRDNGITQKLKDGLSLDMRSYSEGFVVIVASFDDEETSTVFVLERDNSRWMNMFSSPLIGRRATAFTDIVGDQVLGTGKLGIVKTLEAGKQWDPSLTFRKMVEYFTAFPDKQVHHFYTAAETGAVDTVFTPTPDSDGVYVEPKAPNLKWQPEAKVNPEINVNPDVPVTTPEHLENNPRGGTLADLEKLDEKRNKKLDADDTQPEEVRAVKKKKAATAKTKKRKQQRRNNWNQESDPDYDYLPPEIDYNDPYFRGQADYPSKSWIRKEQARRKQQRGQKPQKQKKQQRKKRCSFFCFGQ
jgi:hypothetical protein